MGKNILKKSLVLTALMTFVITGSVFAEKEIIMGENLESVPDGLNLTNKKYQRYEGENADKVESVTIKINKDFTHKYIILWTGATDKEGNPVFDSLGNRSQDEGVISNCHLNVVGEDNKPRINVTFDDYVELVTASPVKKSKQWAHNNTLTIKNANINAENGSIGVFASFANKDTNDALLSDNSIQIIDSSLKFNCSEGLSLYAAEAFGTDGSKSKAINNSIKIDNLEIIGYDSTVYDNGNSNTYQNGKVIICGGYARLEANNNKVSIKNTNLKDVTILGGYVQSGTASDNEVFLSNVEIKNTKIYGGYIDAASTGTVSGNKLHVYGNLKDKASLISGFNEINFNDLNWIDGEIVIKTTDLVLGDDANKTVVNVNGLAEGSKPKKGEVMTLIDADSSSGNFKESKSAFTSGNFLKVEGEAYKDNNDIKFIITRVGTNDQVLVIGESRAAATAFTNQGSELISIGIDKLARDKSEKGIKTFASVLSNRSKYETGSHVKVNGWSGLVGIAKTNENGLTYGAFFENGEGNYRTYNVFEGDFMRGDGEANYNGGGLFVRKENTNGVYTEASLRVGNLQNELRNAVVADNKLEGYDVNALYYGAHVGVGKIIPRGNEGDNIDIYGKFIYTHHDDEDFTIGGDDFHFDSVNSESLRLGFRINEVQDKKLSMYYGAAWEYEFGGDADNTVIGYDLSAPSLSGGTVIGELGMHYKASDKWNVDLNLSSYGGQREGFTGSVQANYLF